MKTQMMKPGILFSPLSAEPRACAELALLRTKLAGSQDPVHLILDLSRVEIMSSPSISNLLLLRKMQSQRGARLILCRVHLATRCILRVVGLYSVFECAADKFEALRMLHSAAGFESPISQRAQDRH